MSGMTAVAFSRRRIKLCGSLSVFLQGHPEYPAGALGRGIPAMAVQCHVVHFLAGNGETYLELPANYLPADSTPSATRGALGTRRCSSAFRHYRR